MDTNGTGIVKLFNDSKRFGWIIPEGSGEDRFAYFSSSTMSGFESLTEGRKVSFEITMGTKAEKQSSNIEAA